MHFVVDISLKCASFLWILFTKFIWFIDIKNSKISELSFCMCWLDEMKGNELYTRIKYKNENTNTKPFNNNLLHFCVGELKTVLCFEYNFLNCVQTYLFKICPVSSIRSRTLDVIKKSKQTTFRYAFISFSRGFDMNDDNFLELLYVNTLNRYKIMRMIYSL